MTEENKNPETDEAPQQTLTEALKPTVEEMRREALKVKIERYIDLMKPGRPVTPEEGGIQQWVLLNTVREILSQEGSDFTNNFAMLLNYIHENRRGVFAETHVYRYLTHPRLSGEDGRIFQRLMNLFLATADPRTRYLGLKQVNLATTVRGLTGDQGDKLRDFYEI